MKTIQILGSGCAKCKNLAAAADLAAKELGQPYQLVKITDIAQIIAFGVISTPALAVDGAVKSVGKVPSVAEIKALIA
jgi:small redox-active disulfide protein 2